MGTLVAVNIVEVLENVWPFKGLRKIAKGGY
jgi:hypothetical protein